MITHISNLIKLKNSTDQHNIDLFMNSEVLSLKFKIELLEIFRDTLKVYYAYSLLFYYILVLNIDQLFRFVDSVGYVYVTGFSFF